MDLNPAINRAIRRIAEAIEHYAHDQGWKQDSYRWYYRVNPDWNYIDIILVSDAFLGRDYYESYQSVSSFLESELGDDPLLAKSVGLALLDFKKVAEGGLYAIGPDYQEYWTVQPVNPSR